MWHITTFDPRNPQYGAIWFKWSGEIDTLVPGELAAFSPYTAPFSCRVNPGDTVTFEGYARVSEVFGAPQILIVLRWYNSAGGAIGVSQSAASNLSKTRTLYTHTQSAPAGVHYLRASFAFAGVGDTYTVTVVDSARLGIA